MKKADQKEQTTSGTVAIDKNDLAILKLLQANARVTVKEISEKIHLSTTPVHERIKRLEQSGVIKQYATLLDPNKVDRGLMVICYVSLKEHSKSAGVRFIKNINDLHTLDYSGFGVIAVKAIQEQYVIIESQQQSIHQQQAEINELKKQVSELIKQTKSNQL